MADLRTIEEYEARQTEIRERIAEIDAEFAGQAMDEAARTEWNDINEELEANEKLIDELRARKARVDEVRNDGNHTETETQQVARYSSARRATATRVPDDATDVAAYRNLSNNIDDLNQAYRDGARKLIETRFRHQHPSVSKEEAQDDVDKLIDRDQAVAMRVVATSSRGYQKEFATYVKTGVVGKEMLRWQEAERALTTGTGSSGGYAVPIDLDTTLILTNNGVVNPIRQLARVRQTNSNTVEWVSTAGITAGFGAEATEASDNSPTLAQPTANIEKGFAFVPMSIEIAEDWPNIQADMAMLFADAKNQAESLKFLKGLGHTSHEPQGLITPGGATAVVSTAATAVFAVGDLYSLENALGPRYRNGATFVGNRAAFQKVRQFASNGVNIWEQLPGANPPTLLGYPVVEWSNYDSTPTTSGSTILTLGNFNYFGIADRVGLNVEFIPHLFGSSNRYPTGQRGLYMYWRTSSALLSPSVNTSSAFQSLKVL